MALDPNIILQAGKGVVPLKDPTEIADEQAQRQLRGLQLQQAQQGIQDDQTYRQALQSGSQGQDLVNKLYGAGLGKQAQAAQQFQTEQQKAQYERGKQVTDAMKVAADQVMQNPTEQNALSALDNIASRYGIPAQHFDAGKAAIMQARGDPNQIRQLMAGLGAKADEALGKITSENLGGVQQTQRVNPITGQVDVLSQQARTQSPDNVASVAQSASNAAMTDARAREANALRAQGNAAGRIPSGYRLGADGQSLEFIPGGPADPNTKPAGGKPLNDTQAKALQFGSRMQASGEILDKLSQDGVNASVPGSNMAGIGSVVTALQPAAYQQLDQAKRDFVNAVLRRESGAAISASEFDNANKQYFPQVGDSEAVRVQKKANRELATRGILAEVPDADTRVAQVRGGNPAGVPTNAEPTKPTQKQKSVSVGGKDYMAELAPDGKYYVQQNGKWFEVR